MVIYKANLNVFNISTKRNFEIAETLLAWFFFLLTTITHLGTDHLTCRGGGELEYLFFLSHKARIFFQNLTLGYMTKTLNQSIFFFLHQNQNIFSAILRIRIFFLEKNHSPPPPP